MLRILSQEAKLDCGRVSRRDFLRVGALGLGGLALPSLLAAKASGKNHVKDKAVVFLFLCGGASQIETFDPKMNAPAGFRSTTGEIKTSLPGVTFGSTFPGMARRANRLAVVRSYQPGHDDADHARAIKKVFTVGHPMQASIGAMSARVRGQMYSPDGVPNFASLIEKEVDSQYVEDEQRMVSSDSPGALGAAYTPFTPRGGGINRDMTLSVPLERLNERRELLRALDTLNRHADSTGAMAALDEYEQRAVEMILGGKVRAALDLANEDPKLVEAYDTSRFMTGYLTRTPNTLGRRLLMARRLVEAGCAFVTVGMAGWDAHGNDKHPGVKEGMEVLSPPLDRAVSAFLADLEQRGLSEKVLLVITSEFGRTPKVEPRGGRDHWPALCPLVLAGGGLKMGQVIGKSTAKAEEPDCEPVRMQNLLATIMHTMFDVGEARVQRGMPTELLDLIESAPPIAELM